MRPLAFILPSPFCAEVDVTEVHAFASFIEASSARALFCFRTYFSSFRTHARNTQEKLPCKSHGLEVHLCVPLLSCALVAQVVNFLTNRMRLFAIVFVVFFCSFGPFLRSCEGEGIPPKSAPVRSLAFMRIVCPTGQV